MTPITLSLFQPWKSIQWFNLGACPWKKPGQEN